MTFYFPHAAFTLEDVLDGKINQKNFSESERYVLNFVKKWFDASNTFTFRTSGSTGTPKEILLSREQLRYSALETLRFLFPNDPPRRMLLCIDPRNIGGTQVITRALLAAADLVMVTPTANPLDEQEGTFDLISMVPLQVGATLPADFERVRNVLIGGADLSESTRDGLMSLSGTTFYQTYGMTETASHFALKALTWQHYRTIGDIHLAVDDRECLVCRGTVTAHEWLQTNDVVSLVNEGFIWKGRADWVINSGGIKIHPEMVEKTITSRFPEITCVITGIPDELLGQKVVLVTNTPILEALKHANILGRYEVPKLEVVLDQFPRLANEKVDRLAIKNIINENE